ncbi:uncharacterized protein LOC113338874 [Papaver somniferum]|uniref:uncharacterized protein LOC113338874 n=1 Tax=Papaver somniferum TaxID=3469 RepID=UPI000E6F60EE|nr:uncharacterized protein LOC113338874 [Papaver somniferum]
MINGQEYKVEDFWDQNKQSEQLMKDLVEAIRRQLGRGKDARGSSGKSAKSKNARPKSAPMPLWIIPIGITVLGISTGILVKALLSGRKKYCSMFILEPRLIMRACNFKFSHFQTSAS